jgi:hypothetical protein
VGRVLGFWAFGLGGIGLSLGAWGYHAVAYLGWVDAFSDSSMILSGMGPAAQMPTDAAKIFAGVYEMVAGLAWTALLGAVLYPSIHRILRALHLEMRGNE